MRSLEEQTKRLAEELKFAEAMRDEAETRGHQWFEVNAEIDRIVRRALLPIIQGDPNLYRKANGRRALRALASIFCALGNDP